jgi:HK97 family phage major capsid protein
MECEIVPRALELGHPQAVARLRDLWDELERLRARDVAEDGPGLAPEDETRFNELTAEYAQVDAHRRSLERAADIARVAAQREELRTVAEDAVRRGRVLDGIPGPAAIGRADYDSDPISNPDSIAERRFRNPWDLSEVRTFDRDPDAVSEELRSRALSAIERMPGASDNVRQAATVIVERFDDSSSTLARMVLATSSPEYMRAWGRAATGRERSLSQAEVQMLERAMSLTDAAGGYLVPFQIDPSVINTGSLIVSDIRAVSNVVVATGDVWHGITSAGATWSWDTEGQQVSDDSPTIDRPEIPNHKGAGFIPASIESTMDIPNFTQQIGMILADGKNNLEAPAYATGSGVGQPTGYITALIAAGSSVVKTSATTDTFAIGDVYALDGDLAERYQANASWMAHRKIYNLIRQFDTSGGGGFWENLGGGMPSSLLGSPARRSESMDSALNATVDNYLLAKGDFRNFVITDRVGFAIEYIPHVMGANGRPTGERGFYAYYRTGSDVVNTAAFRLLNVT